MLRLPAVADKTFLVTIGDRTVGGLVSRDPFVGPWQVPVADAGVTLTDYVHHGGEAMAMGERTPVALLDAPASARLAVAEAVTNILSADVARLGDIRLSANWMAACGEPGEDAALYAAVRAVGEQLCPALGIAIPVGKDSLSMKTAWQEHGAGPQRGGAAVADRLRLRAGRRRAPHADAAAAPGPGADLAPAHRLRREPQPARRLGTGAGLRRCRAARPPTSTIPTCCAASPRRSRRCASARWCWPTTIAPTADCS